MTASLKSVAQELMLKGKFPKKDGGVINLAGDDGEIIVMREGEKVTFQFLSQNGKTITLKAPTKDLPPVKGSVLKPPAKKTSSLAPPAPAKEKKEKKSAVPKEPVWVEQMGYNRQVEKVDFNTHPNIITCACGNIRYVAPGDMHQVTECKPCTRLHRRQRRRENKRSRKSADKGLTFPAKKIAEKAKAAPQKAVKAPVKKK
jgi:hypothetical protein